jgi:hypothetical protein
MNDFKTDGAKRHPPIDNHQSTIINPFPARPG